MSVRSNDAVGIVVRSTQPMFLMLQTMEVLGMKEDTLKVRIKNCFWTLTYLDPFPLC